MNTAAMKARAVIDFHTDACRVGTDTASFFFFSWRSGALAIHSLKEQMDK